MFNFTVMEMAEDQFILSLEEKMIDYLSIIYKKERLIFLDLILLNSALVFSFILRFNGDWLIYFNYSYMFIISVIGLGVLYYSNLYNKLWKYASISELKSVLKVSIAINLLVVIYLFFFQVDFPRSILIINGILEVFFLGGLRFLLRLLRDLSCCSIVRGDRINVLIIGAGDAAEITIREMQKHPEIKKEIIGLIDDDLTKKNLEIHGKKVLGNRLLIPQIIKRYDIKEVIIAIPSAKGKDIKKLYELSNLDGVKVKILPGIFELINNDINLNQIREVNVEDLLRREQVKLNINEISSNLKGKVVLVTGGGGSIGSELCRQVARFNPLFLIIFDIYENDMYFLERELNENYKELKIVSVVGSIRDKDKLRYTFNTYRPNVVFHAAAHKHVPLMEYNPEEAVKNNIFGTRNVAEVSDEFSVERFVLISTDKAVNPTNVMGATKRAAEMLIQVMSETSKTKFMAVRFGNVLGSRGSVIPIFKEQIARGGPVTVTHPEVTRYFMMIPEAVQLVIQAGSLGNGGEVFVLDMGDPVKIFDLARDLIKFSGLVLGEDIEIEFTGLRPGEKLYEELLNNNEDKIATGHERIFISNLHKINRVNLYNLIDNLGKYADTGNTIAIIDTLVNLVKTYEPKRDNVKEMLPGEIIAIQKKEIAISKE
jgi:FlaA1/EpsC-like NDP-sugar epimerase